MRCVKASYSSEEVIKKSRFIGIIAPCANESEAAAIVRDLHNEYPDATHIAYAYRLKTANAITGRFHDDGEPSGTAGKPVYQHLEGKNLINVILAVIRYYGGIKLGVGGLSRAYGAAAKKVLEIAELLPYLELAQHEMLLGYKQIASLERLLKELNGVILTKDFTKEVKVIIELPKANLDKLIQGVATHPY